MTTTDLSTSSAGLQILGELLPRFDEILTPDALDFVAELTRAVRAAARRAAAGPGRPVRRAGIPGAGLGFRDDTAAVRDDPQLAGRPAGSRAGGPAVPR